LTSRIIFISTSCGNSHGCVQECFWHSHPRGSHFTCNMSQRAHNVALRDLHRFEILSSCFVLTLKKSSNDTGKSKETKKNLTYKTTRKKGHEIQDHSNFPPSVIENTFGLLGAWYISSLAKQNLFSYTCLSPFFT
jgi:hypothetical protein